MLIPVVCAALGWATHRLALSLVFHRLLPRRREQLVRQIAAAAAGFMPDAEALEAMVANPAHFEQLRPVVEEQIDHFLRVKLKQSMPVVGMFVGDRTIGQLKEVFVTELESIFPTVMKKYAAGLAGEFDVQRLIGDKLLAIPPETLVQQVEGALKNERAALQRLGLLSGLLTGTVALLLAWCINR